MQRREREREKERVSKLQRGEREREKERVSSCQRTVRNCREGRKSEFLPEAVRNSHRGLSEIAERGKNGSGRGRKEREKGERNRGCGLKPRVQSLFRTVKFFFLLRVIFPKLPSTFEGKSPLCPFIFTEFYRYY